MTLLTISSVKKQEISDDGKQVTLTVDAKHVGELMVAFPTDCFKELILRLMHSQSLGGATQPIAQPSCPQPTSQPRPPQPLAPNQIAVRAPKNWMVASDVQTHGVVLLIFNHQAEDQAGFALAADAAKKMAEGLNKNADAVLASKVTKRPEH